MLFKTGVSAAISDTNRLQSCRNRQPKPPEPDTLTAELDIPNRHFAYASLTSRDDTPGFCHLWSGVVRYWRGVGIVKGGQVLSRV